jgi:dTMP kinase
MPTHAKRSPRTPFPRQLIALLRKREDTRGLLIAFEGPDGAGKTTQRKLFKRWLESQGHRVQTTKWASSRLVRPLIKSRKRAHTLSPEELCLLQAADFRYRLEQDILPALWRGDVVLADRYLFTGLSRDAARGLDLDWMLQVYSPLVWPDLVFYFPVSVDTAAQRVAPLRAPKYYDAGQDVTAIDDPLASFRQFEARVMREYENLALVFRFITVDGEQPIYEQHQKIRKLFQEGGRREWGEWNVEAVAEWLSLQGEDKGADRGVRA